MNLGPLLSNINQISAVNDFKGYMQCWSVIGPENSAIYNHNNCFNQYNELFKETSSISCSLKHFNLYFSAAVFKTERYFIASYFLYYYFLLTQHTLKQLTVFILFVNYRYVYLTLSTSIVLENVVVSKTCRKKLIFFYRF